MHAKLSITFHGLPKIVFYINSVLYAFVLTLNNKITDILILKIWCIKRPYQYKESVVKEFMYKWSWIPEILKADPNYISSNYFAYVFMTNLGELNIFFNLFFLTYFVFESWNYLISVCRLQMASFQKTNILSFNFHSSFFVSWIWDQICDILYQTFSVLIF